MDNIKCKSKHYFIFYKAGKRSERWKEENRKLESVQQDKSGRSQRMGNLIPNFGTVTKEVKLVN
jgi:hypothetical protein